MKMHNSKATRRLRGLNIIPPKFAAAALALADEEDELLMMMFGVASVE